MDDGCRGAGRCLDAVKPALRRRHRAGKAVGVGLGLKNSGLGNGFKEIARAVVRFDDDGTVEVRHCWTEMGQGVHTVALQVAVEELGVDPARVRVIVDTTRELGAGQTTGSRGTLMGAGSVADACRAAPTAAAPASTTRASTASTGPTSSATGRRAPRHPLDVRLRRADGGHRPRDRRIERVVAAHDVGRAVNPVLCEGQIEGLVHMGLGYALTEDFPTDPRPAFPTNMTLRSLGILRPKDVPPIDVILVEAPQPERALRHQGRRRDRPGADGRRGGRRPARPRRRVAHHAADARQPPGRRSRRVSTDHARAGLRPPPPLLGAGPGHAGAADDADDVHGDPRAGVVAPRPRPRPRDDPVVGDARARWRRSSRARRPSSTTTSRPTPSRAAST